MNIRRLMTGVLGASLLIPLAACTSVESFSSAEPASLPQPIADQLAEPIDGTVRLAGEDSRGAEYYVGRWAEEGYCLVMVVESQFGSGCGPVLPVTIVFRGTSATLGPSDLTGSDEDAEAVGDYVIVKH